MILHMNELVAVGLVIQTTLAASCKSIERDVVVLGGGASGTYTAVRLHDSGQSVIVVEAQDRLGGQTETYTDPQTGLHDNYGVVAWHNTSIVRDFLSRLSIPVAPHSYSNSDTNTSEVVYYDFRAHQRLANYSLPDPTQGLQIWAAVLQRYPELLTGFDALPDPVPADLLLPFGEFATKHGMQDALPTLALYGQGGLDYATAPTLYVAKDLGPLFLATLAHGDVTAASGRTADVYDAALRVLGPGNVLLGSRVERAMRVGEGVALRVRRGDGGCVRVSAKKLVVSVPPTLSNLAPLDLDDEERQLFSRFTSVGYYTAIARTRLADTVFGAGLHTPYHLAQLPSAWTLAPAPIPGLVDVKYGAPQPMADAPARLKAALEEVGGGGEVVRFAAHVPYQLTVSPQDVRDGFYRRLWRLQGRRRTWYTGAAWQTQDSAVLWNFTERRVLPLVLG